MDFLKEFNRQVDNLIQKDYPNLASISTDKFLELVSPLKDRLANIQSSEINIEEGFLPFCLVVKSSLVATDQAMQKVEKSGKEGIVKLFPHTPTDFSTIDSLQIPEKQIYLLIDIDRGKNNINKAPSEAMLEIVTANRSPLTIDEGVALITQFPDFLIKNNCYSLLGSRHAGDKRVPAIWINANKNPNLGWCWDGNPHTWLGSASCKDRL